MFSHRRQKGTLRPLGQGSLAWLKLSTTNAGDILACVQGAGIRRQRAGVGSFEPFWNAVGTWSGVCEAPNGDIYVCAYSGGSIWRLAAGSTVWEDLHQYAAAFGWYGVCAAPNGDIYACDNGGSIWMRAGGVGGFVNLSVITRYWYGVAADSVDNVYACARGDRIYKRTGGIGAFSAMGTATRDYIAVCVGLRDEIYASVSAGGIYVSTGGEFSPIAGVSNAIRAGITVGKDGAFYAASSGVDIFKAVNGL